MNNNYKVCSLFCGCGGMDLGFIGGFEYLKKFYTKNNIDIVFANDIDKKCCETYEYNLKTKPLCCDISCVDANLIPDCDIIIGGFPCQDFSLAGKRQGFNTTRGILYKQMLRIVQNKKPKIFVAENVEGLKFNIDNNNLLLNIINDFKNIGYNVKFQLMNTAFYEVPEIRKRIIIIGVLNTIKKEYVYPTPLMDESNWLTVKDAIDDLWNKLDSNVVANHTTNDYSKAKFKLGSKTQGNKLLNANKPSVTIRAEHHGNIEGHYRTINEINSNNINNWRRLTIRECARIQSFPDTFIFNNSVSSSYRQIGNAVPPVFAWHICQSIIKFLNDI